MRAQLLEAMHTTSEDRYCSSWMAGLSEALHEEAGIWELVGRAIGWPVGERGRWTWMSWEDATRIYEEAQQP
ncbi:hypothetical protein ACFY1C_21060 [Streptomyces sp. NPDC001279]|uniref:hypothetical protein n=1 Tax=Streptomyces sp. NPDC001279 TaxID=3364556 RepID=UPI0036CE3EDE